MGHPNEGKEQRIEANREHVRAARERLAEVRERRDADRAALLKKAPEPKHKKRGSKRGKE